MQIVPCRSYHAQVDGRDILRMPDGRSVFKAYYLSILGRDTPERFEWKHHSRTPESFERAFLAGAHEGVGFVIAFPHVTKIFRFSPAIETVLDVREFHTEDMRRMDCSRGDGYHEFACYAEAVIAAHEYHAWAKAGTVEDYLASRCDEADYPVTSNTKLAAYWARE